MPSEEIDITALAELLSAAHTGRPGAWNDVIRACQPYVARLARRHAWANTDPEDMVQEVWIRLLQHAGEIRDPRALVGWLSVVTRRLALELGHRNRRIVPAELEEAYDSDSSTEEQALRHATRRQVCTGVRRALQRLNTQERELLLLLHEDGGPGYDEISQRVGRPIGSLGPTRRRLLDRLGRDPGVRRLEHAVA